MNQTNLAIFLVLSLIGLPSPVSAIGTDEEPSVVSVNGIRNPDLRSYRSLIAGLDAFDAHHNLAPDVAEARFRFVSLSTVRPVTEEALSLRIEGSGEPVHLPIAADGTFVVPRIQAAMDDNADLILNRKKGTLDGMVEIHTAGLPANVRRLGDLRLQCQVLMAIAKSELNFVQRAALTAMLMTPDWCSARKGQNWTQAKQLIDSAIISAGDRRAPVEFQGRSFLAPIADATWSDDALIELQLAPELSMDEKAQAWSEPLYLVGSMNHWAPKNRLRKKSSGVLSTTLNLPAGKYEMMVGAENLAAFGLGGQSGNDQELSLEVPFPVVRKGKSFVFNVRKAGAYTFTLDVRNSDALLLAVTRDTAPTQ